MFQLVLTLHVLVAVAVVALVLIQHGKGADMGAGFGQGASGTVLGSEGALPFLFKLTSLMVAIFFVTSLTLAYMGAHRTKAAPVLTIQQKTSDSVSAQSSLQIPKHRQKE